MPAQIMVQYVPIPVMGTVWKMLTCGIPVPNPSSWDCVDKILVPNIIPTTQFGLPFHKPVRLSGCIYHEISLCRIPQI